MDHHLQSLTIKSFRGLQNLTFTDLGSFNLLVGQNNSGKTSVMEALMLMLRPGDSRNWIHLLNARDATGGAQSRGSAVEWLYPVIPRSDPIAHHSIELECQFPRRAASLRSTFIDKRKLQKTADAEDTPDISIEYFSPDTVKHQDKEEDFSVRNGGIYFQSLHSTRVHAGPVIDEIIRKIPGTKVELAKAHGHRTSRASLRMLIYALEGRRGTILREILQNFDDNIVGLVQPNSTRMKGLDFVEHQKLGLVPLNCFGDGLRKAAYLLDRMLRTENGILLIDEIEVAFHPAVLEPLFAALKAFASELNIQIFATTHSLEAVDAMLRAFEETPRELTAYRLEREPNLVARRFDGIALHDLRHVLGQEIR